MLLPTRYEKLNQNVMVLGAQVINLLRKGKHSVEDLYQAIRTDNQINLERFYNTLSFLWITDVIDSDDFHVFLKK